MIYVDTNMNDQLSNDEGEILLQIQTVEINPFKDSKIKMHYINHLESVYCISGHGEIIDLKNDQAFEITPGTLYALNDNDEHILSCDNEMKLACVFNPPIKGDEVHNKQGAYEID